VAPAGRAVRAVLAALVHRAVGLEARRTRPGPVGLGRVVLVAREDSVVNPTLSWRRFARHSIARPLQRT